MISFTKFTIDDFETLISWIESPELLFLIAGNDFTFPLTIEQLDVYWRDPKFLRFNIQSQGPNLCVGHFAFEQIEETVLKIDKLLIGDKSNRGKGLGTIAVKEILKLGFTQYNAQLVELNVIASNSRAIRCYRNCGLTINEEKNSYLQHDGNQVTVVNMNITRQRWDMATQNN
jgi:RimJ/RimL family protein N-acetyltransferase